MCRLKCYCTGNTQPICDRFRGTVGASDEKHALELDWVQFPIPPLPTCVDVSQSPHFSVPQFPQLEIGDNNNNQHLPPEDGCQGNTSDIHHVRHTVGTQ